MENFPELPMFSILLKMLRPECDGAEWEKKQGGEVNNALKE
jgi:hypothetical protein